MARLVGSTSEGTSSDFVSQSYTGAFSFVAIASGIAKRLWIDPKVANAGDSIKVGIYADNGSGQPGALLGVAGPFTVPAGLGPYSFDISSLNISIVSGTLYHLALRDPTSPYNFNGTTVAASYYERNVDFTDPFGAGAAGGVRLAIWVDDTLDVPPEVAGVVEGANTSNVSAMSVDLPAGGSSSDEYIIVVAKGSAVALINALTDWTELLDENLADGLAILRYTGAGVPSSPVAFNKNAPSRFAWAAYRITGADKTITPELGVVATGTSTGPNSPSVNVTGGPKHILAISFFAASGEVGDTDVVVTTFPTGYGDGQVEKTGGTTGTNLGGILGAAARKVLYSSSEDPGAFVQNASRAWRAQTILLHGLTEGAPPPAETDNFFHVM